MNRAFAYAEFVVKLHPMQKPRWYSEQTVIAQQCDGRLFRESGFSGSPCRGCVRAFRLPNSSNVQRSLCAEFQVLDELAWHFMDKVNDARSSKDQSEPIPVLVGIVQLFTSTSPCLSCIGAIRHFQLLFPEVSIEMGEFRHVTSFQSHHR